MTARPRRRERDRVVRILPVLLLAMGCWSAREAAPAGSAVGASAGLQAGLQEGQGWRAHGGTPAEQRYSALRQVDAANVGRLGLAWSYDLATERGVEATPIVEDGRMFVSAPWSLVHALDAESGDWLWTFDPQVPRAHARHVCCDVVNRGVAFDEGRVFVGTLDGRLVALDAASGRLLWQTRTVPEGQPYSITGAPRVVEGRVVIGNAGGDFGARGYVSAYDARSGARVWRTYTVPGNPADGFESEAMERAAATWTGRWWEGGGGGTVWDAMAYDPALRLLYVGTGNGAPYPRWLRSPQGGDNWFLASILALRPDSGELVWHFQTTPAESWDYTATQSIVLADLEIDGGVREVLLQAPKNGFFYVLDRRTGEFISGAPYAEVNWATGLDPQGRPIEAADVDYRGAKRFFLPGPGGAHNWPPMSFNPDTGLAYFAMRNAGAVYRADLGWKPGDGYFQTALDYRAYSEPWEGPSRPPEAALMAWDPVAQREVWRAPRPVVGNGGTLTTAGNLVFQGTADGRFLAHRATDGALLWGWDAGTGVLAGPVSYAIGGVQYVTVAAGWGGALALSGGPGALAAGVRGGGRVLTFALDATGTLPPRRLPRGAVPTPDFELEATDPEIERGRDLYGIYCFSCHGVMAIGGGSGIPDLRYMPRPTHERFAEIVLQGERTAGGMPAFDDVLDATDAREIHAWLLARAREDARGPSAAPPN